MLKSFVLRLQVRRLRNADELTRRRAAEWIGKSRKPAAVPALIGALSDRDEGVRCTAAEWLGKCRNPAAVPALCEALSREDTAYFHKLTAAALGQIGDPRAVQPLLKGLSGPDLLRVACIGALFRVCDSGTVPLLEERAQDTQVDDDEAVRGQLADRKKLSQALKRTRTRIGILMVLGYLGDERVAEPLSQWLRRKIQHTQSNLYELVNETHRNEISAEIVLCFEALGKLHHPTTHDMCVSLLPTLHWRMRGDAFEALARTQNSDLVEPLIRLLVNTECSDDASKALARLGEPDWENYSTTLYDLSPLGATRDSRLVKPLLGVLSRKPNREEKIDLLAGSAAEALGTLGDTSAVPGLIVALDAHPDNVREEAARALGKLEDRSAVGALIAALGDRRSEVRCAAAESLAQLGDKTWGNCYDKSLSCSRLLEIYRTGDSETSEQAFKIISNILLHFDPCASTGGSNSDGALEALLESGDPRTIEVLVNALDEAPAKAYDETTIPVALALAELRDPAAIRPIEAWVEKRRAEIRKERNTTYKAMLKGPEFDLVVDSLRKLQVDLFRNGLLPSDPTSDSSSKWESQCPQCGAMSYGMHAHGKCPKCEHCTN